MLADTSESIADKYIKKEEYAALYKAIDKLDTFYREIIILHYFEDLKFKEIGEIIGKTEEQVKSAAYEARQKIKKILEATI